MGEIISHLWLGKEFLDRTQKAGNIKGSTFPEPSNIVPLGQPPIKNERTYFPTALTKFIPKLFFLFLCATLVGEKDSSMLPFFVVL